MNITRKLLLTALASAGMAVSSYAGAVLYLSDSLGNTMTIDDNVGVDTSATVGVINWSGTLGQWNLNLSATGVTTGSISLPDIDLSISAATTNSTGGTLYAWYGDTGFGPTNGVVTASIGGTLKGAGSSAEFISAWTAGNDVHPPGVYTPPFLTDNTYSGASFSGTATGALDAQGPYGLYAYVILHQTAAGTSSYDANVSVPDSASTALLIGLGLLGIGFAARRKVA